VCMFMRTVLVGYIHTVVELSRYSKYRGSLVSTDDH